MRKLIFVAVSLLFAVAAFGQQRSRPNAVSVFVSDLSISSSSSSGTNFDAAYGAAFDHMFSDRLSAGISVTSQRYHQNVTTFTTGIPTEPPIFSTVTRTIYPIDATVSYHFLTDSRWKPYIGAGLRYISETFRSIGPLGRAHFTTHETDPEVAAGVVFQFRPDLGLSFEAKQLIGDNNGRAFRADPALKASVGLTFRF